MRGRIAELDERIERGQSRRRGFRVHAFLRLVHDDDGLAFAERLQIRHAEEGVVAALLVDDAVFGGDGLQTPPCGRGRDRFLPFLLGGPGSESIAVKTGFRGHGHLSRPQLLI